MWEWFITLPPITSPTPWVRPCPAACSSSDGHALPDSVDAQSHLAKPPTYTIDISAHTFNQKLDSQTWLSHNIIVLLKISLKYSYNWTYLKGKAHNHKWAFKFVLVVLYISTSFWVMRTKTVSRNSQHGGSRMKSHILTNQKNWWCHWFICVTSFKSNLINFITGCYYVATKRVKSRNL